MIKENPMMKKIFISIPKIQSGDLFLVAGTGDISKGILLFERIWGRDNVSMFSHAGVICTKEGLTLEALPSGFKQGSFFDEYIGKKILLVRPMSVSVDTMNKAFEKFGNDHVGDRYPFGRLILHALGLARFFKSDTDVCSEGVAELCYLFGIRHNRWNGVTPDDLEEEFRNWKCYQIIYDGIL